MSYSFNKPINEPVRDYAPGSNEKTSLKQKINELNAKVLDRKPDFDAIIDSIKLKDGGGDGPTEN